MFPAVSVCPPVCLDNVNTKEASQTSLSADMETGQRSLRVSRLGLSNKHCEINWILGREMGLES